MKHFALILCLSLYFTMIGKAENNQKGDFPPTRISYEMLRGSQRPVASVNAGAGSITLYFNLSSENVLITIYNEMGLPVYQATTDAIQDGSYRIYTPGWETGLYYVVLTDTEGNTLLDEPVNVN